MNLRALSIPTLLVVAVCSCAQEHRPVAAAPQPPQQASPEEIMRIKVTRFDVTPANVRKGQPAEATIPLEGAKRGLPLTLAVFGPDGWLIHDEQKGLAGESVTYSLPADEFASSGRYHLDLRSGDVHLAATDVVVAD